MNFKKFLPVFFILPLIAAVACFDSTKKSTASTDSTSLDMASSAADSAQSSISGLSAGSDATVALNFNAPKGTFGQRMFASIKDFHLGSDLYAAQAPTTTKDGAVPYDAKGIVAAPTNSGLFLNPWNSTDTDFTVVQPALTADKSGKFTLSNTIVMNIWNGLSASSTHDAKIINGTTLNRVVDVTKTRILNGNYVVVTGTGTAITAYTPTGTPTGSGGFTTSEQPNYTLTWSGTPSPTASNFTVNISEEKVGYKSGATKEGFDHVITTPTSLSVAVSIPTSGDATRTIQSGVIQIYHAIAKITMTYTYTNVVYDITLGYITSGTIAISGTSAKAGNYAGSGTITFNSDGTATYEYTVTGGTKDTGTIAIAGMGQGGNN